MDAEVNTDGMLDSIIKKINLKQSQASRQLRVWKDKQYRNSQVKTTINPKDIELSIMEGISMELDEYVIEFVATLHEGRVVPVVLIQQTIPGRSKPSTRVMPRAGL